MAENEARLVYHSMSYVTALKHPPSAPPHHPIPTIYQKITQVDVHKKYSQL